MRSLMKILILSLIFSGSFMLRADEAPSSGMFIIDNFDNPNISGSYQVNIGDQSMLVLAGSSEKLNGKSSLELSYYLKSTLPTGISVGLDRTFIKEGPLNIKTARVLFISVKGDGSGNQFKISFIDGDDEIWEYVNKDVLNSVRWETLEIKISEFKLAGNSVKKNGQFDLDAIKGYGITIYNLYSITAQGVAVKASQGIILLNNFYANAFADANRQDQQVVKDKPVQVNVSESPVKLGGAIYNEYFNVPDTINNIKHWARVDINAHYAEFNAKVVLAGEAQDFGESAYRKDENNKYTGQIVQNYPTALVPFIQVKANNLSAYIANITVGNLLFEYSRYTFSPVIGYDDTWGIEKVTPDWGYKGLSAEGSLPFLNYHAFFIKQAYDSYTYGARLSRHITGKEKYNISSLDFKFYYVNSQDTAVFTNDNSIKKTGADQVYSLDVATRFFNNKIGLEGFYAYNDFMQSGQVNDTDPLKPVYQQALVKKVVQFDDGLKTKLIIDSLFLNNLYITYEFRHLGENFKPKNRMEPILFDDIDSDQNGHNILAAYRIKGFVLTGEFDALKRISNSKFYRNRRSGNLSCTMLKNLLISYLLEWKREYYEYVSTRSAYSTGRDDQILAQEFYVKAQIRNNFDLGIKLRNEDVKWPSEDKTFNTQSVYLKSNLYLANNFLVFAETRVTRFGDVSWYSPGYNPYIDNFVRVGALFNF